MRIFLFVAGLSSLTGCQPLSLPVRLTQETAPVTAGASTAMIYRLDAAQTDIRFLVYRTGPLARLGHNHVISAHAVSGSVFVPPQREASSFELSIPVQHLRVDDRRARQEEGEAFSSQPSEADIEGTRQNMLGTGVLDLPRYPIITVTGRLASAEPSPTAQFTIRLKGQSARGIVPVELVIQEDFLTISGTFELSHEELGLEPFSVMMGALRVADLITFKFRITATPQR